MKWSFCDLKLFSSLIATSKAHTPLGGFRDSARGQSNLELRMSTVFSHPVSAQLPAEFIFFFSLKCHQIISGILIVRRSEWDALPVMTNVVAKVTQRQSQGAWDG